jgi:hypothetical protein
MPDISVETYDGETGEKVATTLVAVPDPTPEQLNQLAVNQALADAMAVLQAIIDDTNANINTNPAARIKDLARAQRRLIRHVLAIYSDGSA